MQVLSITLTINDSVREVTEHFETLRSFKFGNLPENKIYSEEKNGNSWGSFRFSN